MSGNTLPAWWEVTPGLAPHTIGGVLSLAISAERAAGGRPRPPLTRRRVVDYCHVAAALCPGVASPQAAR